MPMLGHGCSPLANRFLTKTSAGQRTADDANVRGWFWCQPFIEAPARNDPTSAHSAILPFPQLYHLYTYLSRGLFLDFLADAEEVASSAAARHNWPTGIFEVNTHMTKTLLWLVGVAISAGAFAITTKAADVLFRESFDDAELMKRGWYDGTETRIAGEAKAGQGCIEYEWVGRDAKVSGSSTMRRMFEPTDEVYLRYYLKLSKGWGWTGRNYHPHLTHFMTTENGAWHGPAASHLTVYIEPQEGNLRLAAQDIQNKDQPHGLTQGPIKGGYNAMMYDSQKKLFTDDAWHCVEAQFKLNTLDRTKDRPIRDGVVRGWFDGQLVIEHTDVILRSTDFPKMKFNQFLMAPYFGPGLLPHAQKLWIDELVVSTQPIGPLPPEQQP